MPSLFDPLALGDLELPNRIVMAPLTRSRANNPGRIPNELMAEYYQQRADAGLILTEATSVTPMGVGYADTPGIWSAEQVEGWKLITQAVHQQGGRIFLQLWHVGRISHSLFLNGEIPVAPSAIKPAGHVSLVRPETTYQTPRALAADEIPAIISAYKTGAENAKAAGFDGVEVHAANGYLIDQFLQDSTNHRTDQYGGSIENRARLLLEITDAILEVWPAGKVGMHLSPRMDAHDMGDSTPLETFTYVAKQLGARNLAFIFTREHLADDSISPAIKAAFGGPLIANEGFNLETAKNAVAQGTADAVAFGKDFIATPDLVDRFKSDNSLNEWRTDSFYQGGAEGYTDYPML